MANTKMIIILLSGWVCKQSSLETYLSICQAPRCYIASTLLSWHIIPYCQHICLICPAPSKPVRSAVSRPAASRIQTKSTTTKPSPRVAGAGRAQAPAGGASSGELKAAQAKVKDLTAQVCLFVQCTSISRSIIFCTKVFDHVYYHIKGISW